MKDCQENVYFMYNGHRFTHSTMANITEELYPAVCGGKLPVHSDLLRRMVVVCLVTCSNVIGDLSCRQARSCICICLCRLETTLNGKSCVAMVFKAVIVGIL